MHRLVVNAAPDDVVFAETDRCTTIAVGRKAGVEGPMVTHTADCLDCDFRINKVPARDWPDDSVRETYEYKGNYPSTIAIDRGDTWQPSNLEGTPTQLKAWGDKSVLTGRLPQVKHTFAVIEAGYGIMNEHQVGIGESTCAAKLWGTPTSAGGKAMIEVRELSRLALERTRTAREAVLLMGALAEEYGFYAADWSGGDISKAEAGEALTVCDPVESWVFHILGDDTGTSAVWVAQRVPDENVAVVANSFIIHEVDPHSPDFLFSKNLWDVAERNGFWNKDMGPLNFVQTYAPPRAHPPYSHRRRWRVMKLVAPSLDLPSDTDTYATNYPFSVKAERPISAADLMDIQRDHYEGTPYDMTKGLASGPFGDPNRFDPAPTGNMTSKDVVQGAFERAISMFRTSYSIVVEPRARLPNLVGARVWFCQYAPATSSYTPIYVSASTLPKAYTRGTLFKYDSDIAFWSFAVVGNYAARFYSYAIHDIHELQRKLLDSALAETASAEAQATQMLDEMMTQSKTEDTVAEAIKILTHVTIAQGMAITRAWKEFFPTLVTKYHDGYIAQDLDQPAIHMKKLFYPKWWLEAVGFFDHKPDSGPGVIMYQPSPNAISSAATMKAIEAEDMAQNSTMALLLCVILSSGLSVLFGVYLGQKFSMKGQYSSINV
eukprot:CAMPEP_0182418534 /NCGR_PEP_ID=MMETSP1167-20130531/2939_1 /TAXON_ID=2988 /ORGANISM="Mallomonas Sp, Strain CCMP3275" /LENGTH=659 /DNA_ID=CAMNT_0024592781 /DNA_START=89 /DNA_END=2068 /DNA_ORIENTATION=-